MKYSILRLSEVISKIGLSKSTIYERIKQNDFPSPIYLGNNSRSIGFIESELDEWIESRISKSRDGINEE
jgi:prophage regulatory protein